jgi:hypothetical protein
MGKRSSAQYLAQVVWQLIIVNKNQGQASAGALEHSLCFRIPGNPAKMQILLQMPMLLAHGPNGIGRALKTHFVFRWDRTLRGKGVIADLWAVDTDPA